MDLLSTTALFEQFLAERRYLKNVTPSTLDWYDTAFKGFRRAVGPDAPVTKQNLQRFVVNVRERGVRAVSCNTYIKAMNAFCVWLHAEKHSPELIAMPLLRTEKRVLVTLTDVVVANLVDPKVVDGHVLDTSPRGARDSEAPSAACQVRWRVYFSN